MAVKRQANILARAKKSPRLEDLITQSEAAAIRNVSVAAINELAQRKRLQVVERFGRKLLYRSEVESFEKQAPGPKARKRMRA